MPQDEYHHFPPPVLLFRSSLSHFSSYLLLTHLNSFSSSLVVFAFPQSPRVVEHALYPIKTKNGPQIATKTIFGHLIIRILAIKTARSSVLFVTLNIGKISKLKFHFGLFLEKEEEGERETETVREDGGGGGRRGRSRGGKGRGGGRGGEKQGEEGGAWGGGKEGRSESVILFEIFPGQLGYIL